MIQVVDNFLKRFRKKVAEVNLEKQGKKNKVRLILIQSFGSVVSTKVVLVFLQSLSEKRKRLPLSESTNAIVIV